MMNRSELAGGGEPQNVEPPLHEVTRPERTGYGAMRVLLLGLAAALLIGSTGYVVSVALDPQPGFGQTMCVDSTCTYAMSVGMPMSASNPRQVTTGKQRSRPERLVRHALSFLHLR